MSFPYSGSDSDHQDALSEETAASNGSAGDDLFGVEMNTLPTQAINDGSGGFDTLELRGSDPAATWSIVVDGNTTTFTAGEAAGSVVATGADMTGYISSSFDPDAKVYFNNIDEIKVA